MRIDTSVSAINVLNTQMAVSAHNIANVNTNEFQAGRADLETGPGGEGVRVADIRKDETPGPARQSLERSQNEQTGRVETSWQTVEGSNTDLAREFVQIIATQNAYEANVATIRTQDQMMGTVLDIKA